MGFRRLGLPAVVVLLASALWATPAHAARSIGGMYDPDVGGVIGVEDPGLVCLAGVTAAMSATPDRILLGSSVTLSWTARPPAGCSGVRISYVLHRQAGIEPVPASGSRSHQPIANETLTLHARYKTYDLIVATTWIGVTLPQTVYIYGNHLGPQLVQALRSTDRADRNIIVSDNVEIDLTQWVTIEVAPGVTLRGGRGGLRRGPRLYTTSRPKYGLLQINGDNVRISGVRLEGPDFGPVDGDEVSRGIFIQSAVNVEIDHNELSGWTSAAIEVQDQSERISFMAPYVVRIRDNFFHHNQHVGGNGYGVSTRYGAFALIERNVFDWNRHAIAADARFGTGYAAYENLVLENGGLHWQLPIPPYTWFHTHQFDAHGTDSCLGSDHNCGLAGHSFYITHNTFLYTHDNAIKLRGTTQLQPYGMFVSYNMFAHGSMGDAVTQTESGLYIGPGNVLNNSVQKQVGVCDFDGDGINDDFMTTGATWWYASGGVMQWTHLNRSTLRLPQISLGYFDGDARCDVYAGGTLYPGGRTPPPPPPATGTFLGFDTLTIQ